MSDVRKKLYSALTYSARRYRLSSWFSRFPKADEVTGYDNAVVEVNPFYVDEVLGKYTEQEIITILAAARLEGAWTPE